MRLSLVPTVGDKRQPHARHGPLSELATRQHGVVSTRQLIGLGYSRKQAAKEAQSGRLHRLYRGVYAVGHRDVSWNGRCLGALLACAPAVASHGTAAWLWGLLRTRPSVFHLTAPTCRHVKPDWIVHHARLHEKDLGETERIPVTAVPRTLLDLAATMPADRFERVLERSEERGLFDLRAIDSLLQRTVGHPGHGRLRAALEIYRPRLAITRSGVEERFLELVRAAGLPPPATNFGVGGYELDAYWEEERFAVELDVFATHGSRAAFERDRLRQEDLKLIGVEMIRVTGPRLDREPERVIARLRTLLAQRRGEKHRGRLN